MKLSKSDRFWWEKAGRKLARIAKKYKFPYQAIAYAFACLLKNNRVVSARAALYRWLNTGEVRHNDRVRQWINEYLIYGTVNPVVDHTYRALMGDQSAFPVITKGIVEYFNGTWDKEQNPWQEPTASVYVRAQANKDAAKMNVSPLQLSSMLWCKRYREVHGRVVYV